MAKRIRREARDGRAELQAWYLTSLRPRLASAARAGKVPSGAAAALDSRLADLLLLVDARRRDAA
jgi:hypothetical protein